MCMECVCMYGWAQRIIVSAPHAVGTNHETLENMTVYSRYMSGNSLPVKYHEPFASICFCVVASVPNSKRAGEDILGH